MADIGAAPEASGNDELGDLDSMLGLPSSAPPASPPAPPAPPPTPAQVAAERRDRPMGAAESDEDPDAESAAEDVGASDVLNPANAVSAEDAEHFAGLGDGDDDGAAGLDEADSEPPSPEDFKPMSREDLRLLDQILADDSDSGPGHAPGSGSGFDDDPASAAAERLAVSTSERDGGFAPSAKPGPKSPGRTRLGPVPAYEGEDEGSAAASSRLGRDEAAADRFKESRAAAASAKQKLLDLEKHDGPVPGRAKNAADAEADRLAETAPLRATSEACEASPLSAAAWLPAAWQGTPAGKIAVFEKIFSGLSEKSRNELLFVVHTLGLDPTDPEMIFMALTGHARAVGEEIPTAIRMEAASAKETVRAGISRGVADILEDLSTIVESASVSADQVDQALAAFDDTIARFASAQEAAAEALAAKLAAKFSAVSEAATKKGAEALEAQRKIVTEALTAEKAKALNEIKLAQADSSAAMAKAVGEMVSKAALLANQVVQASNAQSRLIVFGLGTGAGALIAMIVTLFLRAH